ncbi:MAG: T9SS type A sorting domain-containing protein [Bacteroidetes bacterium]|nr:T9SS type A sorting domain-containing protein [Bacteroidota bacterium]MBS1607915.1 T9SS type A sorting domain-containing protein [Bacteroidota bacterium]
MRILILPLVIAFVCCSVQSYSATGDACSGANGPYTIPVDGSCNNFSMSTVTGNPSTAGSSTCAGYPNGKRVTWFSFTPITYIMAASFLIQIDVATQMQATIYDNVNCGSFNSGSTAPLATLCSANGTVGGTLMVPGSTVLIPGHTYTIRVYSNVTGVTPQIVHICATPVTKQAIPVNGSCNIYNLDAVGTGSNFSPLPTGMTNRCGYNNDKSVTWFQFTPSSNLTCATFNIAIDNGARTEIALYNQAGAYQSGSTLCMPDGNGIWAPSLPFTFTAGNTYYLRVYAEINDALPHIAQVCASPYTPPNDLCSGATRIDNNGIQDNNVCATGSAPGGTEPGWITSNSNTLLCAPVLQNTAWYYFVVNDNTTSTIVNVSSVNCDNYGGGGIGAGGAGIQLGLLKGPSNLANCVNNNALTLPPNTPTHCYQTTATSFGFTVPPNAAIQNGTKMYIAVDGYSGANCSYVITTTNAIPIPVKMKYFTVWKQATSNQLRWITSWETNNRNFEIERSLDGQNFVRIGSVPGLMTSNTDVQYKFDDFEIPLVAYYRLKQVDIDGKYDYSNTIVIKRDNIKSLFGLTFANPVANNTVVSINTETAGTSVLRIMDLSGRELSVQVVDCNRGNNIITKDFSRLAAGHYFLIATQGENRVVKPFIKQ